MNYADTYYLFLFLWQGKIKCAALGDSSFNFLKRTFRLTFPASICKVPDCGST